MKIYIYICLLIWGSLVLSGCNKLLDEPAASTITNDTYWKTEGDVAAYIIGMTADVRDLLNSTLYFEDRSDVFIAGLEGPVSNAWAQNLTGTNAPNWRDFYNMVHHANLVLKYAPKIANSPNLNRSIAQARFFRAYAYFSLLRIWGDVPIILQPTESADVPLPSRAPALEVMSLILSDIEESLKLFPENGLPNKNKVSKPLVYALKADALLWKNKVLNGDAADLEEVIVSADQALASGVSILDNFDQIHSALHRKNNEIIFSLYFMRDERSDHYGSRLKPRDIFVATATNVSQIPFARNGARSVYAPSPQIQATFAANDIRKSNSFITAIDPTNKVIGVFDNKFRGTLASDDRYFDNELVLYRAAEMLLFKAEAHAALNRISEAKTELDKVRSRAGIGLYTGALDKESFELELLNERGREFWLELKRWPDIVRFHYGGTIDAYTLVPNLSGKTIPLFSPIPNTQIAQNPNLKQTAGYTN